MFLLPLPILFCLPELTKLLQELCHVAFLLCTGNYYMGTNLLDDYTTEKRWHEEQYGNVSACVGLYT